MRLLTWKRIDKGTLIVVASVELEIGLRIHDVLIFETNGKPWIALPSKPLLGSDGCQLIDESNSKPAYQPMLAWRDQKLADAFRRAVIKLIAEAHPGTFPAEPTP